MWSHEQGTGRFRGLLRAGAAILLAGLTAACFQPLYGERGLSGGPGLGPAMASVQVAQIDAPPATPLAKMATEVRNELAFALTHGNRAPAPVYRLDVTLGESASSLIVDPVTARAEFELVNVNAVYRLTEISSGKVVMNGSATAQTSYDVPGQQQRYTMLAGRTDAQTRGAKVIAEQIRNRLASYLAAGS